MIRFFSLLRFNFQASSLARFDFQETLKVHLQATKSETQFASDQLGNKTELMGRQTLRKICTSWSEVRNNCHDNSDCVCFAICLQSLQDARKNLMHRLLFSTWFPTYARQSMWRKFSLRSLVFFPRAWRGVLESLLLLARSLGARKEKMTATRPPTQPKGNFYVSHLPDSVQLYNFTGSLSNLGDERQMRDLYTGPADMENHNSGWIVHHGVASWGCY